ncbi:Toxin co-regulated pilus biosynthesis protein Q [Noviherbaspirillum humi]|uniref:Toxin co-regulated pilus biosynthesis protein Q n=1 Tax=Noviherbaspirillum humi TaxID=1688639 RepID=A0A239KUB9_9BURK|nr:toxin co-regulated pilus biosynthesis Q family protein [Noviherbaspirillum humi]SNT21967.1 Toxin co-regulated pilus biosynthesis protein Q [Noviherbaspirillum humi]
MDSKLKTSRSPVLMMLVVLGLTFSGSASSVEEKTSSMSGRPLTLAMAHQLKNQDYVKDVPGQNSLFQNYRISAYDSKPSGGTPSKEKVVSAKSQRSDPSSHAVLALAKDEKDEKENRNEAADLNRKVGSGQSPRPAGMNQSLTASHISSAEKISQDATQCPWEVKPQDGTLRRSLEAWSIRAGWQPYWDMPVDFPVELNAKLCGTFETAIEQVLAGLSSSDAPVRALFYSGNRVIRFVSGSK